MPIPFGPLARLLTRTLNPAPVVDSSACRGLFNDIAQGNGAGGVMITVNHYSAPDFQAWWIAIPISAVFPSELHWLVTSGWRDSGWKTPLSRWLFPLGARLLGFTAMPPIPPRPDETEQRAIAVRQALDYAKTTPNPVVAIAPEGGDQPGGVLGELPPGVGRFMSLLSQYCPNILPVGVWKEQGCIHLVFGEPYSLVIPPRLPPGTRDELVGTTVMQHIAALLPAPLRGKYH